VSADQHRTQAKALLRLAALSDSIRDRAQLIDEAAYWHDRALDEIDYSAEPDPDARGEGRAPDAGEARP
jgi:hypothetical protein